MPVDDFYTKSLLHMDGADASTTFTDESGKTWTANGNAQIDTAQSVFGGAAGLFDGTGDYVSTPDHADFRLDDGSNANAWTVDFRFRFNGDPSATNMGLISQWVDVNNFWAIAFDANNIAFRIRSGGVYLVNLVFAWDPATATWYHLALVKNGTSGYMAFIDGVQIGTTQTDTDPMPDFAGGLRIGTYPAEAVSFNGWIDEVRISKGIARWTSNFTLPTTAYPPTSHLSGGITSVVGVLAKQTQKPLSGNISTITGSLSAARQQNKSLTGSVSSIVGVLAGLLVEAARYPGVLPVLVVHGAGSEYPKSSDRNAPNREIEAICTELGINPKTITDATTPVASPASVAAYLDMVATIIKEMSGAANWYSGAVPIRKMGWSNGSNTVIGAGNTGYARPFGAGIVATENNTYAFMSYDGTIVNLYVRINSAQPASGALTVSFNVDMVANGGITLTIPANSVAGTYSATGTVAVKRGTRLSIKIVNAASTGSAQVGGIGFEIDQVG